MKNNKLKSGHCCICDKRLDDTSFYCSRCINTICYECYHDELDGEDDNYIDYLCDRCLYEDNMKFLNDKLKKDYEQLKKDNKQLKKENEELKKENEKLKNRIII